MNIIDTSTNFLSKSGINNIPLFAINKIEHADLSSGKEIVIFQSPSAVKNYSFLDKLANKKIIAMGPGTQKALQEKGLDSALPKNYNSAGIIEYLESLPRFEASRIGTSSSPKITLFIIIASKNFWRNIIRCTSFSLHSLHFAFFICLKNFT